MIMEFGGNSMKKLFSFFIVLLAFSLLITGCSSKINSKVIPNEKVENISKAGIRDESQWQEYVNRRFGYSIRFPKIWYRGSSSQNNDGIIFYTDNPKFDIRVYGTHYLEGFSKPYRNLDKEGFSSEDITLNNGLEAKLITGSLDDMRIYEMVYVKDNIEYHFYAKVSNEYAKEYENLILNVIKTFNPLIEGEEK